MTTEYHKINSVFKRDQRGRLLVGEWATPELEYLAESRWVFTEKVDGTNVQLHYPGDDGTFRGNEHVFVAGRTNAAQLPPKLLNHLVEVLRSLPLEQVFAPDADVVLYGEGYGAGIQSGGGRYRSDGVGFVLFDVKVGDWWLRRDAVEKVADDLGLERVPVVGQGTLRDGIKLVTDGFTSMWSGVEVPEGVVARPTVDLFDRAGNRIITKIKNRDLVRVRRHDDGDDGR